tara:strand:- start:3587 stop:4951 length:1365 start_codon:yes stop_codon:yes gene_type:complete
MIKKKNISRVFLIFLFFHLTIWTLIPAISNVNLPLDTIEALAWGSNLEWGFNKHPPLSAFIIEIFFQIFGRQDWAYYFLSQIFVLAAFIIIYKFSIDFFKDNSLALISVLLLEGIFFYNFTTPEFNVNVCQLPFWASSVYFTWRCLRNDELLDYILLGICFGLGILSKYLFLYLVIGIKLLFLYFLFKNKIKSKNFLIVGPIVLLIILPHLIWLIDNNYSTITYALKRTGETKSFLNHFTYPLIFILKQIGILIPVLTMIFFLTKKLKFKVNFQDEKFLFLFFTTILPILLIIFTSFVMGAQIRTMWMTPFYLFVGVFLIHVFKKDLIKKIRGFYLIFLFFFVISPITYLSVSLYNDQKRTDYPGKEISRLVQNKWDRNFRNEIMIVVGDEWYAGNLSYHLISRPKWTQSLKNSKDIKSNEGVIYTGNPQILKEVCPGVFGEIRPVGYCMIGQK